MTRIIVCLLALLANLAAAADALPGKYCVTCHGGKRKAGGLSLDGFEIATAGANAEVAEKVIRKLRAGLMPPAGPPRPAAPAVHEYVQALESRIDSAAAASPPNPGWRSFQRLNRAEYKRALEDLLGMPVDVDSFAPPDSTSAGFDNIADAQRFSSTMITGYLRGGSLLARQAFTDPLSRRKILLCQPRKPKDEPACAARILDPLIAKAYRGAGQAEDSRDALVFFDRGSKDGGFENGIRLALQSILVSPRFLFRLEATPSTSESAYPVSDLALASRLSFFLWGTGPDKSLLRNSHDTESQVRRMLADPRSAALSTRFATQWLRLQDLEKAQFDSQLFPNWNRPLAQSMVRETQLFFDSIVREDRSVLDLLNANYSILDERLARHYGIPNVTGTDFRRVEMPEARLGLTGQGSILASTSLADRTSPVLRGKWILEVLMGTPPPPAPPNVPALDDSAKPIQAGKRLNTRQRVEQHRKNPACAGCHRFIDPMGLALENFDATGAWQTVENTIPINTSAELYDGTKIDGPTSLRQELLQRQDLFLLSLTEALFTYASGRRVEYSDMPTIRKIIAQAATQDHKFSSFVIGITSSPAFQMSRPPKT